MNILDTDHLSILEWQDSDEALALKARLAACSPYELATTVISYEESIRGWMSVLAHARTVKEQIDAYGRLQRQLQLFCATPILPFDEHAAVEFQRLRKELRRLATMDLKIAAITLAQGATLLSRNLRDFSQVAGLDVQDWTTERGQP